MSKNAGFNDNMNKKKFNFVPMAEFERKKNDALMLNRIFNIMSTNRAD